MYDFRIHRHIDDRLEMNYIQNEMIKELVNQNCIFFRMTLLPEDNILILEGWLKQVEDQGPEPELKDVIGFGT